MEEDWRQPWLKYYLDSYNSTVQATLPKMLQHQQAADELRKMALNVLLIVNGGGLAAIPAIRQIVGTEIPNESLATSGVLFFYWARLCHRRAGSGNLELSRARISSRL
jgi:hypothetical protein